jgi:hypothetical protein
MRDKSLGIFLMVLFGISGIAILMLAWLWPILESERITATFAGLAGLLMAIIRVWLLKRAPGRTGGELVPAEVDNKSGF